MSLERASIYHASTITRRARLLLIRLLFRVPRGNRLGTLAIIAFDPATHY